MTNNHSRSISDAYRKLDLTAKIILGVAGLSVTVMLGIWQWRLGQVQQELTRQQVVLQTLTMVKGYLEVVDQEGPQGERARALITIAATELSNEYQSPILAKMASSLLENFDSRGGREVLQINEATEAPIHEAQWFTVVASFSVKHLENARASLKEISALQNEFPVEIYKTRISNHFAVTIGGARSKADARILAYLARDRGWSEEAYPQIDRGWEKIE